MKRRERGGEREEGEVEGREREGPKLLLNQGPSEPCYATVQPGFITDVCCGILTKIIIIRSRRQQRSVAQSGHDDEPWTIRHEC